MPVVRNPTNFYKNSNKATNYNYNHPYYNDNDNRLYKK